MHICKTCGESDISKFRIRATSNRPYGSCRSCNNDKYRDKRTEYYRSDKGKAIKAASDRK
jgi:hypothetical protein